LTKLLLDEAGVKGGKCVRTGNTIRVENGTRQESDSGMLNEGACFKVVHGEILEQQHGITC
jgi:hypothetical protein